jgi:hypothetical protein
MSTNRGTKHVKCFINDDLYFYVDEREQRTLPEETLEGTLGFVIKLHSMKARGENWALKIPKLHGATHRENAYINQLMEFEQLAARWAGGDKGLVVAESQMDVFRSKLSTSKSREEDARKYLLNPVPTWKKPPVSFLERW